MTPAEEVQHWVENFVVPHGLCPFAARPVRRQTVRYFTELGRDVETCFEGARTRVQCLLNQEQRWVETELIVYPAALANFNDFLDFVATLEDALAGSGVGEYVQLAHFHPHYLFAGLEPADPANATNRAPWPTVQLLRVDSVARAVAEHPDVEGIPARNVEYLRNLA